MRVRRIETFHREPVTLVRITDDTGTNGWGMTAPFNADVSATLLHRLIAPHVLRRDAGDHESIIEQAYDRNYKFTGTFLCRALAGVDTALWDLRGQHAGKSVCAMLGGSPGVLAVYGSSMRRDNSVADEIDRLNRARDAAGYRAFKIKIGARHGRHDAAELEHAEQRTAAIIPAVAEHFPDAHRYADANGSYDVQRAIEIGQQLQAGGFVHYEEPCPHWDIESTARVRARLSIPIAGGEQDFCLHQWKRMIDVGAIGIAQPDVGYVGGLTRALQVAEMAHDRGLSCVPHSANRSMIMLFAMHLMRAIPHAAPFVECAIEPSPWASDAFDPAIFVRDGQVQVSDAPGWGVTIRSDWLERAEREVSEVSA
ncbi:MAG TPA: mandelate racemase/muconate lactonizing enzyme family protein [Tepidisphaeraceae bacterium]|nr:mandelate racemase/muconate lactonizing enzyme family protein [Tepidisphaeraceae bacterium]